MPRIHAVACAGQPLGITFGDLLKQQRKRAGMTQAQYASFKN